MIAKVEEIRIKIKAEHKTFFYSFSSCCFFFCSSSPVSTIPLHFTEYWRLAMKAKEGALYTTLWTPVVSVHTVLLMNRPIPTSSPADIDINTIKQNKINKNNRIKTKNIWNNFFKKVGKSFFHYTQHLSIKKIKMNWGKKIQIKKFDWQDIIKIKIDIRTKFKYFLEQESIQ